MIDVPYQKLPSQNTSESAKLTNAALCYASFVKNRDLMSGVITFVTSSLMLADKVPPMYLPGLSWCCMSTVVGATVVSEAAYAKQAATPQLTNRLMPFGVIFLPFVVVGLTVLPLALEHSELDDAAIHSMANIIGAICASYGLSTIVPKEEFTLEISHLLMTLLGFMALGTYNDFSPNPISESYVLPLSGALAVIMATATTFIQSAYFGDERLSKQYQQNSNYCLFGVKREPDQGCESDNANRTDHNTITNPLITV